MRFKSLVGLFFSASLFTLAACGGPEAEAPSDAPPSPEMIESAVESQALFGNPLCEDIEVTMSQMQFCPGGGGGPPAVECTRDCVTERHLQWTGPQGSGSPQFICVTGQTECTAWVCDSC